MQYARMSTLCHKFDNEILIIIPTVCSYKYYNVTYYEVIKAI